MRYSSGKVASKMVKEFKNNDMRDKFRNSLGKVEEQV
jgi:hypothetical protein